MSSNTWVLDKSFKSTITVTGDRKLLNHPRPVKNVVGFSAKGRKLQPTLVSDEVFTFPGEGPSRNSISIAVPVYYVPGFKGNSLSAADLTPFGTLNSSDNMQIRPYPEFPGDTQPYYLITGDLQSAGTLPTMFSSSSDAPNNSSKFFSRKDPFNTESELKYWHLALGHADDNDARTLLHPFGYVFGKMDTDNCEACKDRRTGIEYIVKNRESPRKLHTLHVKLSLLRNRMLTGHDRFLLIVDDYTGYIWYIPVFNKTEISRALVAKLKEIQAEFPNDRIERVFASDDLVDADAATFLRERGIHYDESSFFIEELMAVNSLADTMLKFADMHAGFRSLAVRQAVFILNLLHRRSLGIDRPSSYYGLYSEKLGPEVVTRNIAHYLTNLRIFGESGEYQPEVLSHPVQAIYVGAISNADFAEVVCPSQGHIRTIPMDSYKSNPEMFGLASVLSEILTSSTIPDGPDKLTFTRNRWEPAYQSFCENRETAQSFEVLPLPPGKVELVNKRETDLLNALTETTDTAKGSDSEATSPSNNSSDDAAYASDDTSAESEGYVDENLPQQVDIPRDYEEAMGSELADKWRAAVDVEIQNMFDRKAWEVVNRKRNVKPLHCKWVFSEESLTAGAPFRPQATLVACDRRRIKDGIEYNDSDGNLASIDTVLLTLAVAVQNGWNFKMLDVRSAFLNASLDEPVYIQQPKGFKGDTSKVFLLHKSIRGLKHTPQEGYKAFSKHLRSIGFRKVSGTQGAFIWETEYMKTLLVVYVDGVLVASSDPKGMSKVQNLIAKRFEVSGSGKLGALYPQRIKGGVAVDVQREIKELLDYAGDLIETCKFENLSPLSPGNAIEAERGTSTRRTKEIDADRQYRYRIAVLSLKYLASHGRPDLAFVTSHLDRHMFNPRLLDWKILLRTLCYLNENAEVQMCLYRDDKPTLVGYAGGNAFPDSHGGILWTYGDCPFYWESRRHHHHESRRGNHEAKVNAMLSCISYGNKARTYLQSIGEYGANQEVEIHTHSQIAHEAANDLGSAVMDSSKREELRRLMSRIKIATYHVTDTNNPATVFARPMHEDAMKDRLATCVL